MYLRYFERGDLEAVSELFSLLSEYIPPEDVLVFSALWPRGQIVACDNMNRIVAALFGTVSDRGGRVMVLVVDPEHRRKGLATALLRRFRTESLTRNLATVTLEVRPSNSPALSLYLKMGFRETGYLENRYSDGEDCIVMEMSAWKSVS